MKTTIRLIRAHMRRIWRPERIGPNSKGRIIAKTPLSDNGYLPVVGLIILICLANPVPSQSEDIKVGALSGETTEYCSTDTPREIPDKDTITSSLTISDSGAIFDLNVSLNITHSYNTDMEIFLIAPDGTRIKLLTDVGGSSDNFENTILDDEASQSITEGEGPFRGFFRPEESFADLIGKDTVGTWILEVTDDSRDDVGTLESWCLIITSEPGEPLPAPIIEGQASGPGGIHDMVSWDDVGEIREYGSTTLEDIPDQGTMRQTLTISDLGIIEDLNVKVNIEHNWDSELDVYLVAPDGTQVELFTDVGGSQDDFIDTILDDQSSMSITEGTAPFTGQYHPEGVLNELIGQNIHGEWTLEITDDSWYGSGTLNSWSLIADLADVLYYVECATDAGFSTVVADSGWTINHSHTFPALDPSEEHWYRAKARPLEGWSQTSQADFQTDTLTDTEAVEVGDVVLPNGGGGGLGPEVHVIENPSFEQETAWMVGSNNLILLFTSMVPVSPDLWVSDGRWSAGVLFSEDFSYDKGDIADYHQPVDWTGVETLVLDYCSILGSQVVPKVLIGDTEVWSDLETGRSMDVHNDVTIDVSDFSGTEELRLRVEVDKRGRFWAGILWDNLRTYGPSGSLSGSVISIPISIRPNDTWDILEFDATIPAKTDLTVDVLPETGSNPISGCRDLLSGTDLSDLNERTIRLRANFSTSDPTVTPALHHWAVSYSDAGRESDWSNVESSLP